MMEAKTLPPKFWDEAINCAYYIQNRVPRKQLDGMNPFESWSGHKLDVTHFRIFGSKTWARIPNERERLCSAKDKSAYLLGILNIHKFRS